MMRTKFIFLFATAVVLIFACFKSNGTSYPFALQKSGHGAKSIILIPGLGCSAEVWDETIASFNKNFTCYALTMSGFAGEPPKAESSFSGWKDAIANFIIKEKITKPTLVGHSMGGALAMAVAAEYPDLVSKIVVVDALPCLPALLDPHYRVQVNTDCKEVITKFTSLTKEQFYQMQRPMLQSLVADTTYLNKILQWSVKSDRTTFAKLYCDLSNTDLRAQIATISCPALILLESHFVNFKPAIEDQFSKLTTSELHYATKGLHFIMFDDKVWFMEQLSNFLNQK